MDNWIAQNLQRALNVWNDKLGEIWTLMTQSPQEFKGGAIWGVISTIHGTLQAIGYALLVLFFVVGVMKTCGNIAEMKRPELALKLFIRFGLAQGVITYGMELMLALLEIVQGIISNIMSTVGFGTPSATTLPDEIITAIEDCSFFESIPLWAVTLIGGLFIWVLSFVLILSVYGRFFRLYMYTAIAPIPLSSFAGEPSQNIGKSFLMFSSQELCHHVTGIPVHLNLIPRTAVLKNPDLGAGGVLGDDRSTGTGIGAEVHLPVTGIEYPGIIIAACDSCRGGSIAGGGNLLFAQQRIDHIACAQIPGPHIGVFAAPGKDSDLSASGQLGNSGEVAAGASAQGSIVIGDPGSAGACLFDICGLNVALFAVCEPDISPAVAFGLNGHDVVKAVASDDRRALTGHHTNLQRAGIDPVKGISGSNTRRDQQYQYKQQGKQTFLHKNSLQIISCQNAGYCEISR